MFISWITNRLTPAFKKIYWTAEKKQTLILVLDNAPYHHKDQAGCINVNTLNKFKPSPAQRTSGDCRTLRSVALEFGVPSLAVSRGGELVPQEELNVRGKLSVDEFRTSLQT